MSRLINSDGSSHDNLLDLTLCLVISVQILGDSRRIGLDVLFLEDIVQVELIAGFFIVVGPAFFSFVEGVCIGFLGTAVPEWFKE